MCFLLCGGSAYCSNDKSDSSSVQLQAVGLLQSITCFGLLLEDKTQFFYTDAAKKAIEEKLCGELTGTLCKNWTN